MAPRWLDSPVRVKVAVSVEAAEGGGATPMLTVVLPPLEMLERLFAEAEASGPALVIPIGPEMLGTLLGAYEQCHGRLPAAGWEKEPLLA